MATTTPNTIQPKFDWTIPSDERLEALLKQQTPYPNDIQFIDPSSHDHLQLPSWLSRFPLFITIEMVNRGICVYCLLRFLMNRHDDHYRSDQLTTINTLFGPQLASVSYSTPEIGIIINEKLGQIKEKLITTAQNEICTLCFNVLNQSQEFLDFLTMTVDEADYQFDSYHIQRTLPPIFGLKQFGLWHYLKHMFAQYVPFFTQNQTPDGNIIELKECFKLQIPSYTTALNANRDAFQQSSPKGVLTPHIHTINQEDQQGDVVSQTILPTPESLIQSHECNFITSRRSINKNPIEFNSTAPFHIDIYFHTVLPEYTNQLYSLAFNRPLYGDFAASSQLFKSMSMMGLSNMKAWGLSPPQHLVQERINLPTPLHDLVSEDDRKVELGWSEDGGFYTPQYNGVNVLKPLPFLPKKLYRYPSANEFNAKTFMINKYCFIQISCKHNPVFISGTYCKRSRMISHSSWYHDLSFYEKAHADIPQRGAKEAKDAYKKNNQFLKDNAEDKNNIKSLSLLDVVDAQAAQDKSNVAITSPSTQMNDNEAPVHYDQKKKRRNFEHDEMDEVRAAEKKQRQLAGRRDGKWNDKANKSHNNQAIDVSNKGTQNNDINELGPDNGDDADEVVSINELDDLFTGARKGSNVLGDDNDGEEDDDDDGFGAMLQKRIDHNREKGDGNQEDEEEQQQNQDNDKNKKGNNHNKNGKNEKIHLQNVTKTQATAKDNPNEQNEDDSVGQGSLPYAESSVETEIACRLLPYFHSINHTQVSFNVVRHPKIEQSLCKKTIVEEIATVFDTKLEETDGIEFVEKCLHTTTQLHVDHDPTPPALRYAGYCSIHSSNPNGIPCTHYHREAYPGPIDDFYTNYQQKEQQAQESTAPGENTTSSRPLINYNPYRLLFHARMGFKFHSSGREDLNVRMLGNGRPFLIEILDPHRLPFEMGQVNKNTLIGLSPEEQQQRQDLAKSQYQDFLSKLMTEINTHSKCCAATSLEPADQASMDEMTKGIAEKRKVYRCVVHSKESRTKEELESKLNNLGDVNIIQNTPVRVLFRRAALQRPRHINNIKATYVNPHFFYLDLETQAGTYVKEFVHSDKGRTNPSISSLLGTQCDILQLDVTGLIL